eukprot:SAG11_NODE_215_length_12235_cov_11.843276_10_plen_171_part_00
MTRVHAWAMTQCCTSRLRMFVQFVLLTSMTTKMRVATAQRASNSCSGNTGPHQDGGIINSAAPGTYQYPRRADCQWALSCSDPALHPQLRFNFLDTESNFDFVNVLDGDDTSAPRLTRLSGRWPCLDDCDLATPAVQTASGPTMVVHFTSDRNTAGHGFSATWWCFAESA